MHPILFEIPLPAWALPLAPTLFLLSGVGLVLAFFGHRQSALDLLVIGVLMLLTGVTGGFLFRGQRFLLEPIPIYSYGAMLCLSIVVGWFLTLRLGERDGMARELLANCYFVTAIAALIGSRVLYVLTNPGDFHGALDMLAVRRGGLVAYGGFLGGLLGSWGFLRWRNVALLPWADVAVPSLASGLMLTRIGCYLFGCDFGTPLPAAAPIWLKRLGTFPRWPSNVLDGAGSPAWLQHVDLRGLSVSAHASLPVHPTELYESLAGAALLILTWQLRRAARFRGEIFLAFTIGYGYLRFVLEIVRDDSERGSFGPAAPEHVLIPLLLVLLATAFAYGPARSIGQPLARAAAIALSLCVACLAYLWLRPAPSAAPSVVRLSTSQWISLTTALAASVAWPQLLRALAERSSVAADDLRFS